LRGKIKLPRGIRDHNPQELRSLPRILHLLSNENAGQTPLSSSAIKRESGASCGVFSSRESGINA
jgi:hypothetical protein